MVRQLVDLDQDARLAYLEARVAELEERLERRSRELRIIQRNVCTRDLAVIARVLAGLRPLPYGPFDPDAWPSNTELLPAQVHETLAALWHSLAADEALPPLDA
jgi:hypothetical protein